MTVAVLFAATWTDIDAAARLTGELAAQLTAGGVREVRVLARPPVAAAVRRAGLPATDTADPAADLGAVAALAGTVDEPLLLCTGDLVAHASLLWMLATEPAGRSSILIGAAGPGATAVRHERGRVVATAAPAPSPATPAPSPATAYTDATAATAPADSARTGAAAIDFFLGALCVAPADLPALAAAAGRAAGVAGVAAASPPGVAVANPPGVAAASPPGVAAASPPGVAAASPPGAVVTGIRPGAVDLLLAPLLAGGVHPAALRVRLLHAERVADAGGLAAARATVAAVDEDAARLRLAVKERDDFFTTFFVSTWSPWVTRWAARCGLTPSGVTWLSVLLAAVAAVGFWQASRPAMVAAAVLLYLSFVLDCVDGQVARYTRHFQPFGGWLDAMADRAKEYAVYAGLAAGADRLGLTWAWPLAIAAITLQTVRHMTDTWYGALHDEAAVRPTAPAQGPAGAAGGVGERLSRASNKVQADTGSVAYWMKRIVVLPIGERWALLCLLAAVSDGRTTLLVLLAAGLFAAAYTLLLRSLRSRVMRVPVLAGVDTGRHRDDGPLVRRVLARPAWSGPGPLPMAVLGVAGAVGLLLVGALGTLSGGGVAAALAAATALVLAAGLPAAARHTGALDWLVPAALRAAEYLFVAGVGMLYAVPAPLVFGLLWALAMRHYDLTARMEKGTAAPAGPGRNLGWDGRVVVLAVAAAAGLAPVGMALLAGYVVFIFGTGAIANWSVARAVPTPMPEGGNR